MGLLDLVRKDALSRGEIRFVLDGAEVDEAAFIEGVNAGGEGRIEFSPLDEDLVVSQVLAALNRSH